MLARALDAGVPAAWVTADEAYGKDGSSGPGWSSAGSAMSSLCPATRPSGQRGTSRADVLAAHAPAGAWKRRSCGNGAKGPRMFDWAVASLPGGQERSRSARSAVSWHI